MKRITLALLISALLLAGCARGSESLTETLTPAPSLPETAAGDCASVADFSFRLFAQSVQTGDANPVISPLSAYLCLAMVQNGAAGGTLQEFETLLGLPTDTLNQTARALNDSLENTAGSTALSIANSAWADDGGVTVNDAFLQAVVDTFGAEIFSADLPSDAARKAVNDWVSERSRGLIPSLRENNYPDDTQLVLLNTLYFKGVWQSAFYADNTFDDSFTPTGGEERKLPCMHMSDAYFDYILIEGADGVILPYDDGKTVFVALLPAAGTTARELAASLTADTLADGIENAAETRMNLSIPKFSSEFSIELNDTLEALGLRQVFDPAAADLSRLGTGANGPLYLSLVQQKVKLIVDEKGAEAAAVTEAAAAGAAYMPDEPLQLSFDRPFVYAVLDVASGVPLFMGILDDPII